VYIIDPECNNFSVFW